MFAATFLINRSMFDKQFIYLVTVAVLMNERTTDRNFSAYQNRRKPCHNLKFYMITAVSRIRNGHTEKKYLPVVYPCIEPNSF